MNRICICGHLEEDHGHWEGSRHLQYETACLVLNEWKKGFDCPNCYYFKVDNLKSLEYEYQKTL